MFLPIVIVGMIYARVGHRGVALALAPVAPDQAAEFFAATVDQMLGYAHGGKRINLYD